MITHLRTLVSGLLAKLLHRGLLVEERTHWAPIDGVRQALLDMLVSGDEEIELNVANIARYLVPEPACKWNAPPPEVAFEHLQNWVRLDATRRSTSIRLVAAQGTIEASVFCRNSSIVVRRICASTDPRRVSNGHKG